MIDLKAARANPDAVRAALARKGAAEAFDALLEADERWRALVPARRRAPRRARSSRGSRRPSSSRSCSRSRRSSRRPRTSSPPAEAERDAPRAARARTRRTTSSRTAPPRTTSARCGASASRRRSTEPREHTEVGRFDMERAARMSGSRFGYWIGDTARLALALYRLALDRLAAKGFVPVLPPVLVREQALVGTGAFPVRRGERLRAPRRRPVPRRHGGDPAREPPRGRDPRRRRAAASVRRASRPASAARPGRPAATRAG